MSGAPDSDAARAASELPAVASPGPGAMLARGRESRHLSVEEVAGRLKFAPRQIESLEADEYAKLPGTTIVRGMIRGYARLLGMDSAPMLRAYEAQHASAAVEASEMRAPTRIPFPDGRARSSRLYTVLIVVIVLTMAAVLYEWQFGLPSVLTSQAPEASPDVTRVASVPQSPVSDAPGATAQQSAGPEIASPAALMAVEALAAPASVPSGPTLAGASRLVFDFSSESWVEVKDRAGKMLISQLNPGGSRTVVEGVPPFSLVIGNASQVRLRYNDAPVDLQPHIKVDVARMTLK